MKPAAPETPAESLMGHITSYWQEPVGNGAAGNQVAVMGGKAQSTQK